MKYFVLLFALAGSFLKAQTPQENMGLSCGFLCFERGVDGLEDVYAKGPGGTPLVKVNLATVSGSSETALFPVEGKLVFYRSIEGTGPPVAVATVPTGAAKVLVLFFPNPVGAASEPAAAAYRTVVFDLDSKIFPPGGCAVLNVHDKDVRFIIGEHQIQLNPGKIASVARPEKRDKFNMTLTAFQYQNGDKWQTVYETMEHFPPEQRKLYVVYLDAKVHRPRSRSYTL